MPGRGPQTFKKRQKEQQRKEKQQEKMTKRLVRKDERAPLGMTDQEDTLAVGLHGIQTEVPETTKPAQTAVNAVHPTPVPTTFIKE
jgi:hypothetical protein